MGDGETLRPAELTSIRTVKDAQGKFNKNKSMQVPISFTSLTNQIYRVINLYSVNEKNSAPSDLIRKTINV